MDEPCESWPQPGDAGGAEAWQAAQERVLRYLKALGVPPLESLGIAREILEGLEAELGDRAAASPVREAMRRLHHRLEAARPSPQAGSCGPDGEAPPGAGFLVGLPALFRRLMEPYRHVRVAPPLVRGAMPAGGLNRRGPRDPADS